MSDIKRSKRICRFFLIVMVSFALFLSTGTVSEAQIADSSSNIDNHKWTLSFGGVMMSGTVTPALWPDGTGGFGGGLPIERPFGFGLSIDYNIDRSLRLFLDGNFYTYRKQVGIEGQASSSQWVFEMNNYETDLINFSEDAYFYMQTTGFRFGAKYAFQKGGFRPWVGAGIGFYAWKADYATADRSGSWGSDNGTTTGITYLFGVDYILGRESKKPIMIAFFGDFAAPVARPVIENLFHDGWTWDNSGGNHIMGPYRFGISIGFFY